MLHQVSDKMTIERCTQCSLYNEALGECEDDHIKFKKVSDPYKLPSWCPWRRNH